ncbi:MAG: choice-of-anchor D domain-containing protein, partial [Lysobacterales bacterium]
SDCAIVNNNTTRSGGGIYNVGSLTIDDCDISGNSSDNDGAGISIVSSPGEAPSAPELDISNCIIANNISNSDAGAISTTSANLLRIDNCLITGNEASSNAGGVQVESVTATITDSTISGNTAGSSGMSGVGGGLYVVPATNLTVSSTTISGNESAFGSGGVHMFAISPSSTITRFVNSTISGNQSLNLDPAQAGGIYMNGGTHTIENTTVVDNVLPSGFAGGVFATSATTVSLINSVLARNVGSVECSGSGITATTSLIEDGTCSAGLSGAPALAATLADNGGPTQTHAVLPLSPVVDAGNQTSCDAATLTTDQTGMPRPIDGDGDGTATCDLGAFEFVDIFAPSAGLSFAPGDITGIFGQETFSVNFADDAPIDQSTLGVDNIQISPAAPIEFLGTSNVSNGGRSLTGDYRIIPPGGFWDAAENGTYTLSLAAGEVFDTASPTPNGADSAQQLDTFEVTVPQLDVSGNGLIISEGDTTPSAADDTNFGEVAVGATLTRTFTIANSGLGTINLTSPIAVGGAFSISAQPADTELTAGESTTFDVSFNTDTAAVRNSTVLIFKDIGIPTDAFTFTVSGTGISPEIAVSGNSFDIQDGDNSATPEDGTDFGAIATGESVISVFTIANTGDGELTINGVTVSGSGFSVTSPPATTIAPAASTTFAVTFNPNAEGQVAGEVSIDNTDADENPYTFALRGEARSPDIRVRGSDTEIANGDDTPDLADNTNLGNVTLGESVSRSFDIRNVGLGTINLTGPVTVSGGVFTVDIQPDDTALGADEDTLFRITGQPVSFGTASGVVTIPNDDPDESPFTFSVSVTAIGPDIEVSGNGDVINNGDDTPDTANGTDFGNVSINASVIRSFVIRNTGSEVLVLGTLQSSNPAFTVTRTGSDAVNPAESSGIDVAFLASSAGPASATISIANNDVDDNPFTFDVAGNVLAPDISISGNALDIPDGDTTPDPADGTDFGGVLVGDSVTRTFTIANTGNDTLNITGIETSFLRYTISSPPASTVAAGETAEFAVTFTPVIGMEIGGRITITSNDPDESPYTFDLTALGLAEVVFSDGFEEPMN